MLTPLIDISPFRLAIKQGQLILTANQRLAAKIHDAWAIDNHIKKSVWITPRVYSLDHWIKQVWEELHDKNNIISSEKSLLGAAQSRYYWERAINQNDPDKSDKYARLANETLTNLERWNLSIDDVSEDTTGFVFFKRWAKTYQRLLNQNKLITTTQSWQIILDAFEQSLLLKEPQLYLYGFQSIPPRLESLLNSASIKNNVIQVEPKNLTTSVVRAADSDEELRYAAAWAVARLADNPESRIGLVVPNLNYSVAKVTRVLDETLHDNEVKSTFNISAGIPLSDTSLVNSGLNLLNCLFSSKPLQEWIETLHNPYWLFDNLSMQSRVDAEVSLRKAKQFDLNFNEFCHRVLNLNYQEDEQQILKPLAALWHERRGWGRLQQGFSSWALFFTNTLIQLGWPGRTTLDSLEFQQKEAWQRLLEDFCGLDNLGIQIGLKTAIKYLGQLAHDSVFHCKTADAPIQILGMLESGGLQFNSLWIMGMDSHTLPARTAINPLLPAEFQRLHAMPHSLPERELSIAQSILSDYGKNSSELIISYSANDGEEDRQPSPLISHMPRVSKRCILGRDLALFPQAMVKPYQAQLYEDNGPVYDKKIETISTGSNLFKHQAACPFNAFAIHRLKAKSLDEPIFGLSALDRGSIVHDILFELWSKWERASYLHQLSREDIADQVGNITSKILDQWAVHHIILRGDRYRTLEAQRLKKLVEEWLEFEITRPLFEIQELERKQIISFGDLEVALRFDRLDKINDQLIVIDYKTGAINPKHWHGDRPRDPQLPLYVVASEPPVDGCAFAQIRGGAVKFLGLADEGLLAPRNNNSDWKTSVTEWQLGITSLAQEFSQGIATMEVYNPSVFQYQSNLLPLNRWSEVDFINELIADIETTQ
ncbi:MAG: PD-(D/E)XK nuclease family protein [Porticoccaceae bacterium]|nr:PD-(D/E)XK nuclease family protein [Porticoccaceae bacterium]